VEIELWKNSAIQELAEIVKTEYDELGQIISQIEATNEDFEELGKQKPRNRTSAKGEDLVALIKAQQALINAQRHYAQQLEDLLSSAHSLLSPSFPPTASCPHLTTDAILTALRGKRQEWAAEVGGLEAENSELKNILDNMIALVREEKRGRG
jgi:hypothetical protein